jgi:DNA-binding transcriptional MerR regulator
MPRIRRIYDEEELALQRCARRLRAELGINAAGIEVILRLRQQMLDMQTQLAEVEARLEQHAVRRSARFAGRRALEIEAIWDELNDN